MDLEVINNELIKYSIWHYTGSLDFPCYFCGGNSYDNYHFEKNGLQLVVCKDCLLKVLKGDD